MMPTIYEPKETDFTHGGVGFLSDCSSAVVVEERNGQNELTMVFPLNTKHSELMQRGYQIRVKPNDEQEFNIFVIYKVTKDITIGELTVYARSRTFTLGSKVVRNITIDKRNGLEAMSALQKNISKTDIQFYSDVPTVSSTHFDMVTPLECIAGIEGSLLQRWGGEIKHEPFQISLLRQRGREHATTVRYGKNLDGLEIDLDWGTICTRIFPYAETQNHETENERIYGNAVDSPLINNYEGEIFECGVPFSDVKDLKQLNRKASKYFTSGNPGIDKPKINVKTNIRQLEENDRNGKFAHFNKLNLCDTFTVIHERYNIELTAKVTKLSYDCLNGKTISLEANDAKYTFFESQKKEISNTLIHYADKPSMSDFIQYTTRVITGNDGGHVVFWPKNRPSDILITDNADINKAKEVLRMNKSGIGFSKKGWQGPFDTAWTIDGNFNANFIQSGKIRADIFETSFNSVGDTLRLVSGLLQIWNKKKIMELTKKGMQFWSGNKEIGTIGTTDSTGNPFPNASTPTPIPDNALVIRTEGNGKYILISPNKDKGFVMLTNGTTIHFGDLNLQGKLRAFGDVLVQGKTEISKDLKVSGTIDAKKITINGQEVFPGQGGGGNNGGGSWNGMYPPEVTTQPDKFAWELWVMLLSKGYSKASAAGILGNVQGEAGVSMNPDIAQIGGPAYGIVQWDGSAYPLVPPATYDGRTYVQHLMRAAGITEDYKTMSAQGNLLDWTMYNGQWLGIVQPGTQSGFKSMTDPAAAAYTFERNYERPANAHPERQGWAINWYNKFKDLQIPSAGGILSTAKSLIEYFHYSQPMRWNFGSVESPDKNGYADCSSFVWLALTKAGYRTAPRGTLWYTGSMTADARGARQYLSEVAPNDAKAGDIIIVNQGAGAGNDGHTAVLAEDWHGYTTSIVEMGGMQAGGVGVGRVDWSFGYLLNGGDVCLARAKK